jgi:hypothetical protein
MQLLVPAITNGSSLDSKDTLRPHDHLQVPIVGTQSSTAYEPWSTAIQEQEYCNARVAIFKGME